MWVWNLEPMMVNIKPGAQFTRLLTDATRQKLGQRDTVALSNISAAFVSDTVDLNLGLLLDQELSMVNHKHCLLVSSCIAGSARSYLAELCVPVSSVAGRQILRSASQGTPWYLGSGQNCTVDGVSSCQDHTSGTYYRQEFILLLRSRISSRENLNII